MTCRAVTSAFFHGVEGFGASSLIHTTRLLSLADGLPVAVVIVDGADRIWGWPPSVSFSLTAERL